MAASQAERRSTLVDDQAARHHTPESGFEDIIIPSTHAASESQGDIITALAIRTPEHLQGPPEIIPTRTSEP